MTCYAPLQSISFPDSKYHGADIGPIWGRQDPDGPHVGHMNFAIWVVVRNWKILTLLYWHHHTVCLFLCVHIHTCMMLFQVSDSDIHEALYEHNEFSVSTPIFHRYFLFLSHSDFDKLATILQVVISNTFGWKKKEVLHYYWNFNEVCSKGPIDSYPALMHCLRWWLGTEGSTSLVYELILTKVYDALMMLSSNGNFFPCYWPFVQGIHRWIPLTKARDVELWCFLWYAPE